MIIRNYSRFLACIIIFISYIIYSEYQFNYIQLVFGFLFSYLLYTIFGAKHTGDKVPLTLYIGNLHIHHWMYYLLFLCIALYYKVNSFIIGLLLGGVCHGIQYKDFNKIL